MGDRQRLKGPERVAAALAELGISARVQTLPASTRTSREAADLVGCDVARIAKSVVFRGVDSGEAVLVVASGANRVSAAKVAGHVGEPVKMADAAFVRQATGYAIGGVPPLGHPSPLRTVLDTDLFAHPTVWAAGGGASELFEIDPREIERASGGVRLDVRE